MTVLFSIIQVLNTGPVSEIGQMGNFLTTKRRPPVSLVKSEFPGYNEHNKSYLLKLENNEEPAVYQEVLVRPVVGHNRTLHELDYHFPFLI